MQKGGLWESGVFKTNHEGRPLVSVITVTYNAAQYLRQALESILNQTYTNVELLVIDGGSTDGTLDIVRSLQHRIDYWQSEPDRGIYDAMNKGLALARGEWVGFKNADDWYTPGAVQALVDAAQQIDSDVFYGDSYSIIQEEPLELAPFFTDHKTLGENPGIDHRSSFVKTTLHQAIPFDLKYKLSADFDVFCRLEKAGARFTHVAYFMAFKRYGGASDGARTLPEVFAINRVYKGWAVAVYLWLKTILRFHLFRIKNLVLLTFLGREGFNQFKSRKLRK